MTDASVSPEIPKPIDERFQVLETKILYQERTVDELNAVVTTQQERIDTLNDEVKRLREIVDSAPQATVEGGEEPPPPHY